MDLASPIPSVVVLIAAFIAATTDVWKFKVYNALTIPLMIGGLIYHSMVGGWTGLLGSLVGLVIGFAVLLLFYAIGAMGAGDVKLMAAIGAWLGMPMIFYVFLASALASGIYAVCLLIFSDGLEETLINLQILYLRIGAFSRHLVPETRIEVEVQRPDRRKRLVPFAGMIAIGIIVTFAWVHQKSLGN